MIEEKISESQWEIQDWSTHAREIESKIDDLVRKGKSRQIISMTLVGRYPYFRDEIRELIEWKNDIRWLEKEIAKYSLKYDISNFNEKQKFFAALGRKGFWYRDIQDFLEMDKN
jgi:SOS response regulatory protein OraA/RecX